MESEGLLPATHMDTNMAVDAGTNDHSRGRRRTIGGIGSGGRLHIHPLRRWRVVGRLIIDRLRGWRDVYRLRRGHVDWLRRRGHRTDHRNAAPGEGGEGEEKTEEKRLGTH
jgi:hypothetical protein